MWHERFGHLNAQSLSSLSGKQMVRGLDINSSVKSIDCSVCDKGKICSTPFGQNNVIKTSAVLEIVHSDICGPMRKESLGGYRYFALFIDDFSRKIFVYFLKNKNNVFDEFKLFKSRVERETGKKIKTLRTDNGCEFLSSVFSRFLESEGIQRQLTCNIRHNKTAPRNVLTERSSKWPGAC